jgi:small-conductance mechanosensitive channel
MEYLTKILQTEIYNGNSVADYLTLDFLVSVLGTTVSAVVILVLGFMISGAAQKRIKRLSEVHARLDATLFDFLSNIARYVILGFTLLFLLNTVGIQTTSIVAVVGAAGLAIGLGASRHAVQCGRWRDDHLFPDPSNLAISLRSTTSWVQSRRSTSTSLSWLT